MAHMHSLPRLQGGDQGGDEDDQGGDQEDDQEDDQEGGGQVNYDIRSLLNMPCDSRAFFVLAHDIIMDDHATMAQRITALRLVDAAIGGVSPITTSDVRDYVEANQLSEDY